MLHAVMTSVRPAPAVPRENPLQAEAAAVERLRRQIAELPAKGEVASPELLAEFARAQKNYLDKKIGFEMQRRKSAGSGISLPPGPEKRVDPPVSTVQPTPATRTDKPSETKAPVPSVEAKPKSGAFRIVLVAVVIAAAAVAAWYFLRRH